MTAAASSAVRCCSAPLGMLARWLRASAARPGRPKRQAVMPKSAAALPWIAQRTACSMPGDGISPAASVQSRARRNMPANDWLSLGSLHQPPGICWSKVWVVKRNHSSRYDSPVMRGQTKSGRRLMAATVAISTMPAAHLPRQQR
jgi:hypothetical protein